MEVVHSSLLCGSRLNLGKMPEHILESCVPLPIPEKELIEVTVKAKDWAIMHGAGMRSKTDYNPDNMFVSISVHTF